MPRRQVLPALCAGLLVAVLPRIVQAQSSADLSVAKADTPDPVAAGSNLAYTITVTNSGPDAADDVSWSDTLPAGTTLLSLSQPGGWTCSTPAVGSDGTVSCSIASLAVGSAAFTLTVVVDAGVTPGSVLSNTADVTSTTADPDDEDTSATETTTVVAGADLQVFKIDAVDPIAPGATETYTIGLTNAASGDAEFVTLEDTLPAGTTFLSLAEPAGWTCATPAVGSGGTVSCSADVLAAFSSATFTLEVVFDAGLELGTVVINTATASSESPEVSPGDESGSASTTVGTPTGAELSAVKTGAPESVTPGSDLTYTITVVNGGPTDAAAVTLEDLLPDGTTFRSLAEPAGWTCTTPAVGDPGTVTCSVQTLAPGSAVFTLVVQVGPSVPPGTVLTNSGVVSSPTEDPNPDNQSFTATNTVVPPPAAALGATKTVSGQLQPNGSIVYTIVLTNSGDLDQADNPGDELVDVLPSELILVSASATSGTAVATPATRTVTWNGALAAGASVTITIQATIAPGVAPGTTISNQATFVFDANGDGISESPGASDDPATAAAGDPTALVVGSLPVVEVPALDDVGLALLALLVALAGAALLWHRG